jgi:prolipoprotein diacylglyceryltransferase
MFAFDFPHNVNRQGIDIQNCPPHMTYCKRLPLPVFPTMMYEILMGAVIFVGLWLFRNRLKVAGQMFFMYLIMNGLERLLIEQIRVNAEFRLLGMNLTQAELIAFTLIGLGTTGVFMAKKWESKLLKW